jgi:hypothetical protein
MKKVTKVLILSLIVALSSCVSQSVPKKSKRAQKKLSKHLTGIDNIVKIYPELMDSITTVVHDTTLIPEHTVDTVFNTVADTAYIDSIIESIVSDTTILTVDKIRYIRRELITNILLDTSYFFEDSLVATTFIIKDGKFYATTKVKEQKVGYVKSVTTLDLDTEINKPAYKLWWFWLMLLIIMFLLYINIRR